MAGSNSDMGGTTRPETAPSAYARKQQEVGIALASLRHRLDQHAARQSARPQEWGFVGDLDRVLALLIEAGKSV